MLTIYKASAGSGKTYNLAKEYILQLVAYKDKDASAADGKRHYRLRKPGGRAHRAILAITFSNQATDEMKRRIVDELAKMANPKRKSKYRSDFVRDYGFDAEQLAQVAHEALQDLLFDFRFFNVSTIDAFFQGVLRSFAREIDLPGNYEVELSDYQAVCIGVAEMFQSLNNPDRQDSQLMSWVISYMKSRIDDGGKFNLLNRGSGLHDKVVGGLTKVMNEDYHKNAEKIRSYFNDDPTRISRFEKALSKRIGSLRTLFAKKARDAMQAAADYGLGKSQIDNTILLRMQKWASGKPYDDSDKKSKTLLYVTPDTIGKRYKAPYLKKNQPPKAVEDAIVEMLVQCPLIDNQIVEAQIIRDNLYLFGLLGYLEEFIANYRRDNNTILLSDTNELLSRIMQSELTPFIYERLGVFLKHFLIDEFQDTSQMQWINLRPLLLESLGNGDDNLIIGDEKQCIYRFRDSNPELLSSVVKQQVESALSTDATVERGICGEDNTNRRSDANIVKFNNTLFPLLAADINAGVTYGSAVQQVWDEKLEYPGYVRVVALEKMKQDEFEKRTLDLLAEQVRRQLQSGYRPKEIAVIVRYHYEGEAVINHLLQLMEGDEPYFEKRFDITSRDALLISSSPLIKLIISTLRLIDSRGSSSGDRTSSAMRLAQLTTRFEYYYNREGLEATAALERALADESGNIDRLTTEAVSMRLVNLHSIVEHIIGTFISPQQRDAHNIFLSAFQDLVVDFCSRGQADVHSFLQWWDDRGHCEKLATPDDLDALTVITIHSSKGLEYKCVHIPFATWEMCSPSTNFKPSYDWYTMPSYPDIDADVMPPMMPLDNVSKLAKTQFAPKFNQIMQEQRVDNLNLFYVAATRATQELLITTAPPAKAGDTIGTRLIAQLGNLHVQDPALTVDVAFDESVATVGEPLTAGQLADRREAEQRKKQEEAKDEPREVNPTLPMPPYETTLRHNVWNMTRIEDLVDVDRARKRGTFLHDVLSMVRRRSDLQLALRRRAHRVGLSAQKEAEFLAMLTHALDDPRVDRWFDGSLRVINERTIDLDAERRERPDRIVWTDADHIEVVDYKFGAHRDDYFEKVRGYVGLLAEIFPSATVTGYLWYPQTRDIVPVD